MLKASYDFDTALRLKTVSQENATATYTYVDNSLLLDNVASVQGGVTAKSIYQYDKLNRLKSVSSTANATTSASFAYGYNSVNQRTNVTLLDNSRWTYAYDSLGQVTSGKRYWSDGTLVEGQQYEYAYDDIGNRLVARLGGDRFGNKLKATGYVPNLQNQYVSRSVPQSIDVVGTANVNSTVSVNNKKVTRQGTYFRGEVEFDNTGGPLWLSITNVGVINNGSSPDVVGSSVGNMFVPKTPELLSYDEDGNLKGDSRWTYGWDAENRLISMTAKTPYGPQLIKFEYDARGRRIRKQVWTNLQGNPVEQKFVYDGWNLIAVLDGQSALVTSFTWGSDLSGSLQGAGGVGGLLWMKQVSGNARYFPAYDGNGVTVTPSPTI